MSKKSSVAWVYPLVLPAPRGSLASLRRPAGWHPSAVLRSFDAHGREQCYRDLRDDLRRFAASANRP